MKILFTGGGTAGHINPALAVAGDIKRKHPDADIRFMGCERGMESKLVPAAGYPLYLVEVYGFDRKHLLKDIKVLYCLQKAIVKATKILKEFRPDVVVGTGGYACFAAVYAAHKLNIPILLHEQNAFPGMAVKRLAKYAEKLLLTVPESVRYVKKYESKCVVTGLPIRREVVTAQKDAARRVLGFDSRPVVLSVAGSLGSKMFNEVVADVLVQESRHSRWQHVHVTGARGMVWMPDLMKQKGLHFSQHPELQMNEYIDMPPYLAACDLIISRCGANSLAEIEAQGKPSILIPSPRVAENHQYHNGMALCNAGAAVMIQEDELTADRLYEAMDALLSDPEKLDEMGRNALSLAIFDANERILNEIYPYLK